jgi:hypothetical protein
MSDETAVTRIGGIQAKHRLTWDDGDGVARCLCGLTWQWCDADGGHRDEAEILAEWEHHVARALLAAGVVVGLPLTDSQIHAVDRDYQGGDAAEDRRATVVAFLGEDERTEQGLGVLDDVDVVALYARIHTRLARWPGVGSEGKTR